jgi:uncharacterized repeat protein (TIGR01451 family)/fimbrial isopeptide formation D2 family protein
MQVEAATLLNDTANLLVSFTNTGDALGYYPMIELKLPAGLECDATCRSNISITTLGGAPVTITAFGPAGSNTTFTNPVTGNPVPVTTGQSVLFISLPVGSVAPNEPAITYSVPAKVNSDAPLGVQLPVVATAVFVLGAVPNGTRGTCAAGVDTLCTTATPVNVTPVVLKLNKSVENLVDGSTATGPSYPRRFKVEVVVAEAKTTTNVAVSDTLPNTFVFTSLPGADCKVSPGSLTFTPALGAGESCSFSGDASGGGSLTVTFASVTGGPAIDHEISYTGFIQELEGGTGAAIVPPATGATTTSANSASANYLFDPGTGPAPFTTPAVSATLTHKSLYTTKSITNATTGGATAKPGDTLTHTLIYDISDYFSFDDLQISDTIGDGQTYVSNSLQVTVFEGSVTGVSRSESQLLAASGAPLQPISRDPTTGEWSIALDLSTALIATAPNGFGADATLVGADDLASGTPTRVVITYDTTVDEEFTGPVVGTSEVDGGDVLTNTMDGDFRIAGTANRVASGSTASMTVTPIQVLEKTIAFENGSPVTTLPIAISPGETLTFRLAFTIPTGDVEGLKLKDFLPSPLFDAIDPTASGAPSSFIFDATPSDAAPAAGRAHLTTASAPIAPIIASNGTENSLTFSFDNESNTASSPLFVELLFTLVATNKPLANDLLLVNVAYLDQKSSQSILPVNQLSAVASLLTDEPKLVVRKFAQQVVTGSGSISGSGADAHFTNVVPGSTLRFGVELENVGDFDAFDVNLVDVIPTGFTAVASSMTFTNCATLGGPIDTSTATRFSAESMDIPAGQTCTLQYDLVMDATAPLGGVITNTATVRYASSVGGPLFSPESDTATATAVSPSLTKAFVAGSSSDPATSGSNLRPGESAEFDVTVTVPPGTAESFTIRERDVASGSTSSNFFENFTSGTITFPSIESNPACSGLFNFVGNTSLCFELNPNATQTQASATVHRVNLGNLRNSSGTSQSFTFRYRATVRAGITPGAYTNRADVEWTTKDSNAAGQTSQLKTSLVATAGFTVVRPTLVLQKISTSTPPLSFGQSAEYQVTLSNTGTATAYDVSDLVDTLPAGLGTAVFVDARLNGSTVSGVIPSQSGQQLTIPVRNLSGQAQLAAGDVYVVRYTAPLTAAVTGTTASLVNSVAVASYATGPIEGGPRETLTNIPSASTTLAVDSNNIFGRAVFGKETAGSTTQNGVSGVTVSIIGTAFSTTTDANGNFSFQGVPDGTYTIRATSTFGDVLGNETVTVANGDAYNVVFQARPRIVVTKTTSTAGTVVPGQNIDYTVTLQNVGNYPAFQVADIQDNLATGLGTATIVTANYAGSSVTGVAGFGLSQAGQAVSITVRNPAGLPQIEAGDTFEVSYRVPVLSSLPVGQITIPNSASIASYATTATTGASTESYLDVRCGEVTLTGSHFTLSGHVRIAGLSTGIPGATIEVTGGSVSSTATTTSDGFYLLTGLPPGSYSVTARTPTGDLIETRSVTIGSESIIDEDFELDMVLTVAKSFDPASIEYAGTSVLTITVANTSTELAATGITFNDIFPAGVTVASNPSVTNTCGGTVTAVAGTGGVQLSGAAVGASRSCQVSVVVTATASGDNVIVNGAGSDQTGPVGQSSNTAALTVGAEPPDPACFSTTLAPSLNTMNSRGQRLKGLLRQALDLRKRYAAKGYCKAADNGCFVCNAKRSACRNSCRLPSASEDREIARSGSELRLRIATITSTDLATETFESVCVRSLSCGSLSMSTPLAQVGASGEELWGHIDDVLDSCCLRTSRAKPDLKQRRSALRVAAKREKMRLMRDMANYPSPVLTCR